MQLTIYLYVLHTKQCNKLGSMHSCKSFLALAIMLPYLQVVDTFDYKSLFKQFWTLLAELVNLLKCDIFSIVLEALGNILLLTFDLFNFFP